MGNGVTMSRFRKYRNHAAEQDAHGGPMDSQYNSGKSEPYRPRKLSSHEEASDIARYEFIFTGYRHGHTEWDAIWSLFEWHTETMNVWTHIIGFLHYAILAPIILLDLNSAGVPSSHLFWFVIFFVCVLYQMLSSAIFHLFVCLAPEKAREYLRYDHAGVAAIIFAQLALGMRTGFWCTSDEPTFRLYTGVLVALLMISLTFTFWSRLKHMHYMVLILFLVSSAFGAVFCTHAHVLQPDATSFISLLTPLLVYVFYGGGFVLYRFNLPERWFPGRVDIIGGSHQWWHLLIIAGSASCCYGSWHFAHAHLQHDTCITPPALPTSSTMLLA